MEDGSLSELSVKYFGEEFCAEKLMEGRQINGTT